MTDEVKVARRNCRIAVEGCGEMSGENDPVSGGAALYEMEQGISTRPADVDDELYRTGRRGKAVGQHCTATRPGARASSPRRARALDPTRGRGGTAAEEYSTPLCCALKDSALGAGRQSTARP